MFLHLGPSLQTAFLFLIEALDRPFFAPYSNRFVFFQYMVMITKISLEIFQFKRVLGEGIVYNSRDAYSVL